MAARRIVSGLVMVLLAAGACTNDYDGFRIDDGTGGTGATATGGGAGEGGDAGSSAGGVAGDGGSSSGAGGLPPGGSSGAAGGGSGGGAGADAGDAAAGTGGSDAAAGAGGTGTGGSDASVVDGGDAASDAATDGSPDGSEPPDSGIDPCQGQDLSSDTANCGQCGRACSTTNVDVLACSAGLCSSSCDPLFANCSRPATGGDDGCELAVATNDAHCGGCNNACAGALGCTGGLCVCGGNNDCNTTGPANQGTCSVGVCSCDGNACRPGENCDSNRNCQCNGSTPGCGANETCCASPAGCFNLSDDEQNCGTCGHACAPAQTCVSGACQ